MGGGRGPNSGGGRRSGGGGHQAGQGEMAARKLKLAKEKAAKAKARAERGGGRDGGGGRGGGGRGGGGGGRGGGGRGGGGRGGGGSPAAEQVAMTAANQALIGGLLNTLGGGSQLQRHHQPHDADATRHDDASEHRADVDPEDVERKAWQALEKKGFTAEVVSRAMRATARAVVVEGDRKEAFNEQKRRRVHRGLDWLILNCDESELPSAFTEEAQKERKKRGGGGKKKKNEGDDDDDDDADPVAAEIARALRLAGFPPAAAAAAAASANGDQWRALADLCAALGPGRDDAFDDASDALEAAGAGAGLSRDAIAEILRNAQARSVHWFPYDRVGVVNADP